MTLNMKTSVRPSMKTNVRQNMRHSMRPLTRSNVKQNTNSSARQNMNNNAPQPTKKYANKPFLPTLHLDMALLAHTQLTWATASQGSSGRSSLLNKDRRFLLGRSDTGQRPQLAGLLL